MWPVLRFRKVVAPRGLSEKKIRNFRIFSPLESFSAKNCKREEKKETLFDWPNKVLQDKKYSRSSSCLCKCSKKSNKPPLFSCLHCRQCCCFCCCCDEQRSKWTQTKNVYFSEIEAAVVNCCCCCFGLGLVVNHEPAAALADQSLSTTGS